MDLRDSESDAAFRAELREWLATTLPTLPSPPAREDWPAKRKFDTDWQRRLFDAGYAGVSWPKAYGGREASPSEELVYYEELTAAGAPYVGVNFVGMLHAGPTLIVEGTDEQKKAHLPKILRGEEVWCQGFSEPNAGSDLASLRTRAVRDGDDYVVYGQKIWSSFAQGADVGELLVRTDPDAPRHRGISWLIMEMDAPGIEIRPIKTVLGGSEFCEVFFDDVRIPVSNRVGDENDGWRVTNVTLSFERGTAFVGEMIEARRAAQRLLALTTDPADRRELGRIVAYFDALWALTKRNVTKVQNSGDAGAGAVVLKLAYSDSRDALDDLAMHVLDRAALSIGDVFEIGHFVRERLRTLALPIAAGSSQIQRNIIGERLLGLPKEPRGEPVSS